MEGTELKWELDPDQSYSCIEINCDYKSRWKRNLVRHCKSVHQKTKEFKETFQCNYCDYKSSYKQHLVVHEKSVHEKIRNFACKSCPYVTSEKKNMLRHCKTVHKKIKDFQCHICPYQTGEKPKLKRHLNTVHRKNKRGTLSGPPAQKASYVEEEDENVKCEKFILGP